MVATSPTEERTVSDKERQQLAEFRRTKLAAIVLLLVSAIAFLFSSIYEDQSTIVGFVRATAEAALVGAIADWFAVVALFKHPLGLPIPHTAIVSVRKSEIGEGLGSFVANNFLTEEVVSEKLRNIGVSRRLGEWLSEPENASSIISEVGVDVTTVSKILLGKFDVSERESRVMAGSLVRDKLQSVPLAPLAGRVIEILGQSGADPDQLSDLHAQLLERGDQLKGDLLDHPELQAWTQDLLLSIQHEAVGLAGDTDSFVHKRVEEAIVAAAKRLVADVAVQERVDAIIELIVIDLVEAAASEISSLISNTIDDWEAEDLIERIELLVGKDLQFIRINGTLVGGLVGFLIHAIQIFVF